MGMSLTDAHGLLGFQEKMIAPGVRVLVLRRRISGTLRTEVRSDGRVSTFTQNSAETPNLAPPVAISIKKAIDQRPGHRAYVSVAAELQVPPPSGAVGVVSYRVVSRTRTPISYAPVGTDDELQLYADAGPCAYNPPGMEAPALGDTIAIAWVDAFGRVSAPSGAVRVTE